MSRPNVSEPVNSILECTHASSQFTSVLVLFVIACTTGVLFLLAPDMGWPLKICLTTLILLTLKSWGSVLVLFAVQLELFFREPRRSEAVLGFTGVLMVCLMLGLLMFINHNRELLRRIASRSVRSTLQSIIKAFRGELEFDSAKAIQEISRMLSSTLRGIVLVGGSVIVSRILLSIIPNRRSFNDSLQTWMLDETSIAPFSLLLTGIIAAWIVCNEISWRQMTREQARLCLGSVFLIIHHADLRLIVRSRLKLRRKAARERNAGTAPSGILDPKNYAGKNQ